VTAAPQRTCIGCRKVRPKAALLRLVRGADGRVDVDDGSRARGRGAYVCADPGCVGKAFSAGRLGHAFKRPCEPPASGVAAILSGRVVNDKARR
jgi:hypothetical protein